MFLFLTQATHLFVLKDSDKVLRVAFAYGGFTLILVVSLPQINLNT